MSVRRALGVVLSHAPAVLATLAGLAVWAVFRPGFMDNDGLLQTHQIVRGQYDDWYPIVVTLILKWATDLGSGLSSAALVQCMVGSLGVHRLATEVMTFLGRRGEPTWRERWAGAAVLMALLVPVSPLMYYLAHYRNDSLAAAFLAWSIAGWLSVDRLYRGNPAGIPRWRRLSALLPALTATVLLLSVRYNAVVLLPIFLALAAVTLRRMPHVAAATATATALCPFLLNEGLLRMSGAARRHPEAQIMALELVGMCVEEGHLRSKLPHTSSHLIEDRFQAGYSPGVVTPIMYWCPEPHRIVRPGFVEDVDRVREEYWRAARLAPATLLVVKAKAALGSLFDPRPWWHHRVIDPNPYGIAHREDWDGARSLLLELDSRIYEDPVLRFFCARHLPWVVLMATAAGLATAVAAAAHTRRALVAMLLILLPMAYYGSHLVAVAAHDYRYMYPSTLIAQLIALCAFIRVGRRCWTRLLAEVSEPAEAPGGTGPRGHVSRGPDTSASVPAGGPHFDLLATTRDAGSAMATAESSGGRVPHG